MKNATSNSRGNVVISSPNTGNKVTLWHKGNVYRAYETIARGKVVTHVITAEIYAKACTYANMAAATATT